MKFISKFVASAAIFAAAVLLLAGVASAQHYTQTNLVSNVPVTPPAAIPDVNLINAWGLVHGPGTPWWISNNNGGTSTLYNTSGLNPANPANQTPPPVLVPVSIVPLNAPGGAPGNGVVVKAAPGQQPPVGTPTGVLFNGNPNAFLLAPNEQAIFIWVTEDGTVQGWNPGINLTTAIIKVDHSKVPNAADGSVYKGATIIQDDDGNELLLAANFRHGRIDAFNTSFIQVHLKEHAFDDDDIPSGFAPFNVQGIGRNVYVTYAKQSADKHDDVGGEGNGFVAVFSRDGKLLQTLQHGPWFNSPWGIALAPGDFGELTHSILIGNFKGHNIAAFNAVTGKFIGNVQNADGSEMLIDGLWSLQFGNGGASGPGNTLFFTAGPNGETDGLFGTIMPVNNELQENDEE
jgi:uncharacterized protein (TIGR03118 family)